MRSIALILPLIVAFLAAADFGQAGSLSYDGEEKALKTRAPKPARFALVFSFGYGGDSMPKDPATFEMLLKKIKDANFNVIHCTYTPERLALCKKHGIHMMIDLLADEHHVYKSPEKAKAVCEKLRGESAVWGYNIWNDPIRKTYPGRKRDIDNVRLWDPTHPAYMGTYRVDGIKHIDNADILGYYDFHWKRGREQHFPHLLAYRGWAMERDAWFCSWLSVTSGLPGKGNFNRSLWSANTAIACGQKGILWFLATDMMDAKSLEWTEIGRDIAKVNRELAPLANELPRLGNPIAVWSTPITKTANNDAIPDAKKDTMPPGLEKHPFTAEAWVRPIKGEFVVGAYDVKGARFLYIANHNAYVDQNVELELIDAKGVDQFDIKTGNWRRLDAQNAVVTLSLTPGGGSLLRLAVR